MRDPTLFYPLVPLGVGTPDVEGLQSYVRRLAYTHHLRPKTLIRLLVEALPLEGTTPSSVDGFAVRLNFGPCKIGGQVQTRLEQATAQDLSSLSLARFGRLFPDKGLMREQGRLYCQHCVQTSKDIVHGRLLWDLGCVVACPTHRLRLQPVDECGASAAEHLPAVSRPYLSTVCSTCGSIGFRCVQSKPTVATKAEVWVARQVGELLAVDAVRVVAMTPERLRKGIWATIDKVFEASVVRAALRSDLPRSIVSEWVRGNIRPSLSSLLKFCYYSSASLVDLLEGAYVKADRERRAETIPKSAYRKHSPSSDALRSAIIAAAVEPEPLSTIGLARKLGITRDVIRRLFPKEASELARAWQAHEAALTEQRYEFAFATFRQAAFTIEATGKPVTMKRVLQTANLIAYTKSTKGRAAREVVRLYALGQLACDSSSAGTQSS